MTYLTDEWTEVQIVARKDGLPIDEVAHANLLDDGQHFDRDLGVFVLEAGGLPVSYAVFLPMHELCVFHASVPYNPAWFGPKSPYPVFEDVPLVFDGYPLERESTFAILWFLRRGDKQPFMANWSNGIWHGVHGEHSPAAAVESGWQIIATPSEELGMSYVMIDEAHERRAKRAELDALSELLDGKAALRVALEAGRLRH